MNFYIIFEWELKKKKCLKKYVNMNHCYCFLWNQIGSVILIFEHELTCESDWKKLGFIGYNLLKIIVFKLIIRSVLDHKKKIFTFESC